MNKIFFPLFLVSLLFASEKMDLTDDRIDVSSDQLKKLTNENSYNNLYASIIEGKREKKHHYLDTYIRVDIETSNYVIEGGLDKSSSLDSIQQAGFFAHLTGKTPVVIIYDTDKKVGNYEHRIKKACEYYGIKYKRIIFY